MKLKATLFFLLVALQCNAQSSDFNSISFKKADSIALSYKNERLTNLPELSYKLTSHLTTDAERFRAIYRWVCGNISNDYRLYFKNHRKRQRFQNDSLKLKAWNDEFKKVLFKKLLKKNTTICTGYAYLVKELCNLAHLDCEIVQGYGRTSMTTIETLTLPNHTWNAVKLDGKWYLSDATWASGIPNPETNRFEFHYNNGFFFPNPKLFAINHYPVDKKWLLLDRNAPTFETFLENPILYNEAYLYLESHTSPKKLHNSVRKNETVFFEYQLLSSPELEQIYFLIDSGSSTVKTKPTAVKFQNQILSLEYTFKRTGFYDVHLYIEDNLIATYVFEVKK